MYYMCGYEIMSVLDKTALPVVSRHLSEILEGNFGRNWYMDYADPIMRKYSDYGNTSIDIRDPLGSFDLTALWFLLFPYERVEDESKRYEGAASYLQKNLNLSSDVINDLESLRSLRNSLVHKNARIRFVAVEHRHMFEMVKDDEADENSSKSLRYIGDDEMEGQRIIHNDALDYIDRVLRYLDPGVSALINEKRSEIMNELTGANTSRYLFTGDDDKEKSARINNYLNIVQTTRESYSRVRNYDWIQAPIGKPIDTPAPWVVTGDDLDDLDWPSNHPIVEEKKVEEKKAEEKKEGSKTLLQSSIDKIRPTETETVTMDDLISAGKNLFGKISKFADQKRRK